MSFQMVCEHCGHTRKVNDRLAGRRIRCPSCEQPILLAALPVTPQEELAVEAEVFQDDTIEVDSALPSPAFSSMQSRMASNDPTSLSPKLLNGKSSAHVAVLDSAEGMLDAPSHSVIPSIDQDDEEAVQKGDEDDMPPPRKKRDDGELDMTPMVDVTFLLLIFFMVTASFSLQKSIQMPKQTSDLPSSSVQEEPTEELDPIELEIDDKGSFLVITNDGEHETPGKQNLIAALREAVGNNKDGMKLSIKVHENAKLQYLVDGMDAGTIAGFAELQVTEVDSFD